MLSWIDPLIGSLGYFLHLVTLSFPLCNTNEWKCLMLDLFFLLSESWLVPAAAGGARTEVYSWRLRSICVWVPACVCVRLCVCVWEVDLSDLGSALICPVYVCVFVYNTGVHSHYVLQPSPSLSLLLKPVVSRELLLPCSLSVSTQEPAPDAVQVVQVRRPLFILNKLQK